MQYIHNRIDIEYLNKIFKLNFLQWEGDSAMKNEVIRTEFGAVLRRMRLKCDLTQQAVADALHVNRATYSYYELGKTQPDFIQLGHLAKIFGVTRETLSAYLEHPEQSADWQLPQRPPKKAAKEPDSLGQLWPEEKSLIALYRLCDAQGQKNLVEAAREQSSRSNQKE